MPSLEIDLPGIRKACERSGIQTNGALARRFGVDPATISRVLNGGSEPGSKFIAGALKTFGVDGFASIFRVVD